MKKKYLYFSAILMIFLIMTLTIQNVMTYSSQAPPGNTGSPGDGTNNTCAKSSCHVGTINSGPGSITIDRSDIPSTGWRPGKTYDLRVVLTENFITNYGFQFSAENPANNNKVGTFSDGGNKNVVVSFTNWISHKDPSPTGDWTFKWTAPADNSQEINFYAIGNAANGNGNNNGDHIYNTSVNIKRDSHATGISNNDIRTGIEILQNPVLDVLRFKSLAGIQFDLYKISGERVKSFYSTVELNEINVSDLNSGMYILRNMETSQSERIIIR